MGVDMQVGVGIEIGVGAGVEIQLLTSLISPLS